MQKFAKTIQPKASNKIAKIKIKFIVNDCNGTALVTDIFLQGGSVATRWTGHPSEINWSFDNG